MGLIKKPLHVVPKHMLEQTASDFMEAYPMANIMVADEENFHTDNRKRFMAQAALNNPDAIIITHSALGKLGMKPENVNVVRDLFIRDLEDLLADLEDDPQANRILIAKTERRIEKMNQRFDGMTNSNTDQAIFFEDLGADFLIVDESHKFRKLDFVTNRQDKGIDSNGSRMALDLYIKTSVPVHPDAWPFPHFWHRDPHSQHHGGTLHHHAILRRRADGGGRHSLFRRLGQYVRADGQRLGKNRRRQLGASEPVCLLR